MARPAGPHNWSAALLEQARIDSDAGCVLDASSASAGPGARGAQMRAIAIRLFCQSLEKSLTAAAARWASGADYLVGHQPLKLIYNLQGEISNLLVNLEDEFGADDRARIAGLLDLAPQGSRGQPAPLRRNTEYPWWGGDVGIVLPHESLTVGDLVEAWEYARRAHDWARDYLRASRVVSP